MSLLFNIYIFLAKGEGYAVEYFAGYIIEMSLSLDNLFLFFMIFSSFGIKEEYQERVLLYGVIGAMILRFVFIVLGSELIMRFKGALIFFGIILLYSGIKMIFDKGENINYSDKLSFKILKRFIPITSTFQGDRFFVRKNKILYATPLMASLVVIEFSDVLFAIDSIPAIFSITTNTLIVYTSNVFAILGLRSMYYILQKLSKMFRFIKYGVALVLTFTGWKLIAVFLGISISIVVSILTICIIMLASILLSLIFSE